MRREVYCAVSVADIPTELVSVTWTEAICWRHHRPFQSIGRGASSRLAACVDRGFAQLGGLTASGPRSSSGNRPTRVQRPPPYTARQGPRYGQRYKVA